jgi:hypothetical protein
MPLEISTIGTARIRGDDMPKSDPTRISRHDPARPSVLFKRDLSNWVWVPSWLTYSLPANLAMLPVASLLGITDDTALFLVIFIPGSLIAALGATLTDRWLRRVYGLRVAAEGITVGRKLHLPWREITRAEVQDGRLVAFAGTGTTPRQWEAVRWDQALGGYVLAELWRYEGHAHGLDDALREFAS